MPKTSWLSSNQGWEGRLNKDFLKEDIKKRKRAIKAAKEAAAKGIRSDPKMKKILEEIAEDEDDFESQEDKKKLQYVVEKAGLHASLFG